jgi:hypothetical protein
MLVSRLWNGRHKHHHHQPVVHHHHGRWTSV